MNQEKIIFDNLMSEYASGAYAHYLQHTKSVGCIAHFLNVYGLIQYDTVQIGNGTVTLHGKKIAEFSFNEKDMPVFTIIDKKLKHVKTNQEVFIKGISELWHERNYLYTFYIKDSYKDKEWFYLA